MATTFWGISTTTPTPMALSSPKSIGMIMVLGLFLIGIGVIIQNASVISEPHQTQAIMIQLRIMMRH